MSDERKPCLNAAFWILFPTDVDIGLVSRHLPPTTVFKSYPGDSVYATVLEVKDFYDWDLDAVVSHLFSLCNLEHLKMVADLFGGKIHIGMWYYSYDSFPSIIFEGEIMRTIHQLNADLSIDAY